MPETKKYCFLLVEVESWVELELLLQLVFGLLVVNVGEHPDHDLGHGHEDQVDGVLKSKGLLLNRAIYLNQFVRI